MRNNLRTRLGLYGLSEKSKTKSKSVKSDTSWKFRKFAKNPINRPFMAIIQGFKLSKSIHTPKRERGFKILGKTSICEVLKRKSDSFAKFAKESDERRESKHERRESKLERRESKHERRESKLERRESKLERRESKLERRESKLERRESKHERRESKLERRESKLERRESKLERRERI
jgi:predicted RNase H-like nuclease (RuvC/YqgF family)